VVAQVNGGMGITADLVAAFAYDFEAGRPNARGAAEQRLEELVARFSNARRQVATSDSVRAARQRPMSRPLADFAGTYEHEAFGKIRFELRGNTLHYRWGAIFGGAEIFDAEKHVLRIEIAGSGNTVGFSFSGSGPARAIQLRERTFVRAAPTGGAR